MTQSYAPLIAETRKQLGANPEARIAVFSVESRQVGGLRSEAKARGFTVAADEPHALGGSDSAPNPVEYVLAALATCQEITYRLYADALNIPLNGVAVKLEGDLDLGGFFAIDDNARAGYQRIRGTVELDSPASPEQLRQLKATVDAHCPVLDMLSNPTPVELTLAEPASSARIAAE